MPTLPVQPTISVVVPVFRTPPRFLEEALSSVAAQVYPNWEVCIADDHSQDPVSSGIIEDFQKRHPDRVRVRFLDQNEGISGASNAALRLATGDYVALLDHDDRLYPNALAEVVRHINLTAEESGTSRRSSTATNGSSVSMARASTTPS